MLLNIALKVTIVM